ncbi:hypothetical protein HYS48_00470, partial [Candidatus Woesearchaeota archaeon]|nr:hypothetical protein [Candidatus Woesearchaeota archaeon]
KKVKAERVEQYEPEKVKKRKDVSFESYFLFGVFALLLLELLYIKRRGDL